MHQMVLTAFVNNFHRNTWEVGPCHRETLPVCTALALLYEFRPQYLCCSGDTSTMP